jgi:hypothetical protein
LTYDPDGIEGPLKEPVYGDIYLFAPKGIIDAGEAGISGGKVFLGATQVLNVQNIAFSVGSVGVPKAADSSVSIGALSGVSGLAETSKMSESAALGAARQGMNPGADKLVDDFLAKWLHGKVINCEGVGEGGNQ